MIKQDQIETIINQLSEIADQEIPERLKDIRELRTGERKPAVPILFGYPSTDREVAAYERLIRLVRKSTTAAKLPARTAPFNTLATHFGGQPYAMPGDQWPECPSCRQSLNFVCQISTNIPFSNGSQERLLYVVYYCFQCRPPVTAQGMGFVVGGYWNPTPANAVPIEPTRRLSAQALEPMAPIWTKGAYYLPSTRELDVEELGLPIQYYIERYDHFIQDLKESTVIIDSGPYPSQAEFIPCGHCQQQLYVTYTIFLGGMFSILCCSKHPDYVVGFYTSYEDCAVGPVKFEILA
jgi:hypothetical protein